MSMWRMVRTANANTVARTVQTRKGRRGPPFRDARCADGRAKVREEDGRTPTAGPVMPPAEMMEASAVEQAGGFGPLLDQLSMARVPRVPWPP